MANFFGFPSTRHDSLREKWPKTEKIDHELLGGDFIDWFKFEGRFVISSWTYYEW